jgi:hypothetical protein
MPARIDYALLARVAKGETTFACDSPYSDAADAFSEMLDALRELEERGLLSLRLRNYYRRRRAAGPAVAVATLTSRGEALVEISGREQGAA